MTGPNAPPTYVYVLPVQSKESAFDKWAAIAVSSVLTAITAAGATWIVQQQVGDRLVRQQETLALIREDALHRATIAQRARHSVLLPMREALGSSERWHTIENSSALSRVRSLTDEPDTAYIEPGIATAVYGWLAVEDSLMTAAGRVGDVLGNIRSNHGFRWESEQLLLKCALGEEVSEGPLGGADPVAAGVAGEAGFRASPGVPLGTESWDTLLRDVLTHVDEEETIALRTAVKSAKRVLTESERLRKELIMLIEEELSEPDDSIYRAARRIET
ncbi:MAG: hypothetical protein WC211_11620 [Dehalococcoidia bacterium]